MCTYGSYVMPMRVRATVCVWVLRGLYVGVCLRVGKATVDQ